MNIFGWLCVALCPFCVFGLITNIFFWQAARRFPCECIPCPPPTVLRCCILYLGTVAGYFVALLFHPLGWAMRPWGVAGKRTQPVLLVHGIYENSSTWWLVQSRLALAGFASKTFSYHSFCVSLSQILVEFEAAVADLEKRSVQKPLVVAHSMGGIIVRLWLQQGNNDTRLAGVVTLGTPHKGSLLARWALGRLVAHLVPESPVLAGLAASQKIPICECISLCSPTDEAVLPACSLVPPPGWQMRVLAPCSHFGLLFRLHSVGALVKEVCCLAAKGE